MRRNKILAGVLSAAMVVGSLTLPENVSISGVNFGALSTQATEVVASGEIIGSQRWNNALYWELDSEGTFTISPIQGNGVMYDYDYECTSYGSDTRIPWYDVKDSIVSVIIEDGVTYIGDSSFAYCENLEKVTVAEGVTNIGAYVFYHCEKLTSVDLPDSLESMGDRTFQYCTALTAITLPQGLSSTGYYPFGYCSALENIIVSEDNETYTSEDGLWYSKDMTSLILCPEGKQGDIVVPESVTELCSYAFADCVNVTSVILSKNIETMGTGVFENCTNLTTAGPVGGDYTIQYYWTESIPDYAFWEDNCLTSITIPNTVTSIGERAFCKLALTDIYFLGSESEWNEIEQGENNSYSLSSVNIHYLVIDQETDESEEPETTEATAESESSSEAEETTEKESSSEETTETETSETESTSEAEEIESEGSGESGESAGLAGTESSSKENETENTEDAGTKEDTGNTAEAEKTEGIGDIDETGNIEGMGSTEDTENTGNAEDTSNSENSEESENTDASEASDTPAYTLGDINSDGFIDYLDAMTALRYDAELVALDEAQLLAGDVNIDGSVDSLDAILILRYDAGLINSF